MHALGQKFPETQHMTVTLSHHETGQASTTGAAVFPFLEVEPPDPMATEDAACNNECFWPYKPIL